MTTRRFERTLMLNAEGSFKGFLNGECPPNSNSPFEWVSLNIETYTEVTRTGFKNSRLRILVEIEEESSQ